MSKIINNTDYLFTPREQQEIRNSAANCGVNEVYTQRESTKSEDANLFHFYADADFSNYLFSIDTDANGSCVIWDKN